MTPNTIVVQGRRLIRGVSLGCGTLKLLARQKGCRQDAALESPQARGPEETGYTSSSPLGPYSAGTGTSFSRK
jgi:hypothetical protein